jgi:hypothetical protein
MKYTKDRKYRDFVEVETIETLPVKKSILIRKKRTFLDG